MLHEHYSGCLGSLTPEDSDRCHCLLHYIASAFIVAEIVHNPALVEEKKFHVALRKPVEENTFMQCQLLSHSFNTTIKKCQ